MLARINRSYVPAYWDDFFNDGVFTKGYGMRNTGSAPSVNIIENEKDFTLEFAAPGISKEDIKIDLDNDILTVSYEHKEKKDEKKRNYLKCEFSYSSFSRRFQLPETIDSEHIKASHDRGILSISLPKKDEVVTKAQKSIEIS